MAAESDWKRFSSLSSTKVLCVSRGSMLFPATNGETEAQGEIKGLTQAIAVGVPLSSALWVACSFPSLRSQLEHCGVPVGCPGLPTCLLLGLQAHAHFRCVCLRADFLTRLSAPEGRACTCSVHCEHSSTCARAKHPVGARCLGNE